MFRFIMIGLGVLLILPKTLNAYEINEKERKDFIEARDCLAKNIYHEARSGDIEEYKRIINVTFNRVFSKHFPNDICSVVYQRKQFSWTHLLKDHRMHEKKIASKIRHIAALAILYGIKDNTKGATHYHATYIKPYWADTKTKLVKSKWHIYYRM